MTFYAENGDWDSLGQTAPCFAPLHTCFSDADPSEVTLWTSISPEEIRVKLVKARSRLSPDGEWGRNDGNAGPDDVIVPDPIVALAAAHINGAPAFPDLTSALKTLKTVVDPGYWEEQVKRFCQEAA